MASYTPTLEITENTKLIKTRELPLFGEALVKVGDQVSASTQVLRAELPGDMDIIRIADRLVMEPSDVLEGMKVKVGDGIKKGELLCEIKTFFGLFSSKVESPSTGTIEFFTDINAHLGIRHPSIPLTVDAYISGRVIEIEDKKSVSIETNAAIIQGIFGVSGESHGDIFALEIANNEEVTAEFIRSLGQQLKGKILIGGKCFSEEALKTCSELKVSAVVTGSINAETLFSYTGVEIGVSITGDEELPFTLIITEGFGELAISKRVTEIAKKFNGKFASVNGATQVRAGAMRPEIVIPLEQGVSSTEQVSKKLELGSMIRIVRVPYFGRFGEVTELPNQPEVVQSGARVRVLRARLESGEVITVPRANVELV